MSIPATRDDFKKYCLRKLGTPVIKINLSDDQIDDRIDEAIKFYYDYYYDGVAKTYYRYQITSDDITNGYVTMPDNILGAVRIFPYSEGLGMNSIFDIRYQIFQNDIFAFSNMSMIPYHMTMTQLALIEQELIGIQPIRYNKNINRVYIDTNWSFYNVGDYLIIEAYEAVDPAVYPKAFGDRRLQNYATALIKEAQALILSKYGDTMKLVGDIRFNGIAAYKEAVNERLALEKDFKDSVPSTEIFIG